MKKILVIHTKYRNQGGEDVAVKNEVETLSKSFIVETLYFENSELSILSDLIAFLTNHNYKSNKLLRERIEKFQPDIAIVHNTWFKANLGIFKVLKKSNIKTFLKIHNFRYICTSSFQQEAHIFENNFCQACGMDYKKNRIFNKYFTNSYIKSLLMIIYGKKYLKILKDKDINLLVLTNHQKNYIEEYLEITKPVTVAVNNLELKKDISDIDLNSTEQSILYGGRVSSEKGVREMIAAFLTANIEGVTLKIIGDGPDLKYLKNKYRDNREIRFLGQISNNEVINHIQASNLVATSTKLFEGQPTILCEASLMGIPSIFPDSGGISEFFPQDYEFSFKQFDYKNLESKIKEFFLLDDPSEVGEKNKMFLEKYLNDNALVTHLTESF
ncbi:glycosyltransferase family 4 protein [Acidimicrobiaceae bacterium]|nr:glycosyltransferase family 4 protein [Acidimicrobiaceae bacterium]